MGANGQANPGLSQIQDILYHTIKKHEQLLVLNVCCPQEENFNKYLIHDVIKSNDWGVPFLCFATQKHIPVILSPADCLFKEFSESETLRFRVIHIFKSDKKKNHILDSCNPTTANV